MAGGDVPDHRAPRRAVPVEHSLRTVAAAHGLAAAVPLLLWAASAPVVAAAVVGGLAGAGLVIRRAARLAACLADCGGFAVDVGGLVRIRVTRSRCCP